MTAPGTLRLRVLLVDDEPLVSHGVARRLMLRNTEMEVFVKASAEEALKCLAVQPVDVLVTDLHMPGMDGLHLLETVRRLYPTLLRFVLTGAMQSKDFIEANHLAQRVIPKPYDADALFTALETAWTARRSVRMPTIAATLTRLGELPVRRASFGELLQVLGDQGSDLESIATALRKDPGMAAAVLKAANSPFYGYEGSIGTVGEATGVLGLETVAALAASHKVYGMESPAAVSGLSTENLWSDCVAVSAACRRIGSRLRFSSGVVRHAAAAALLHEIGKLVMALAEPKAYAASVVLAHAEHLPDWQAEHQVLGNSHQEVGAGLLQVWGLPEPLVRGVAFHHTPHRFGENARHEALLLHLAHHATHHGRGGAGALLLDTHLLSELELPQDPSAWGANT